MTTSNKYERAAGVIRYSCALLFSLFSFAYLCLQGDLLSEAQYVYSHGLTSYSIFFGALFITIALQIIQKIVAILLPFNWQYYSLSYFPSLLLLAILTDITPSQLHHFSLGIWWWFCPLLFILYVFALRFVRYRRAVGYKPFHLLWRNYVLLFLMMLMCGAISRTNEVSHYEYAAERYVVRQQYDKVLDVADQSLHSTRRLTELRMYALSQKGELAERLFDYPQLYGGEGLLSVSDTDSIYRYSSRRICLRLGALPGPNVHSTVQYLWAINSVDSLRTPVTIDYQLCYLLLDRRLQSFGKKLAEYYPQSADTPLPHAYSEAVIYINNVSGGNLNYSISQDIVDRFNWYLHRKQELAHEKGGENILRREFWNTFWWYYEH